MSHSKKRRQFFWLPFWPLLAFVTLAQGAPASIVPPSSLRNAPLPGARLIRIQGVGIDADLGNWHLVRTPGPERREIVSIMHTADVLKSDPDFAGLMIRCRSNSPLQAAFVVVSPVPPRAHVRISVSTGSKIFQFQAAVIPPGSMLSLPDEAEVLVKGPWQSADQLSVDIETESEKIHGVVPLTHLQAAVASLQSICQQP